MVGGKSRNTLELLNQLMILAKKPQDISEPTIHDTSNHLDILAIMTMTSSLWELFPEAFFMRYYGIEKLKPSRSISASNEGRVPGTEGGNGEVKIKVMSESPQSQAIRPFDTSKGQVCALVPGQALDCGIGPAQALDSTTYLSAKDVLRWNKASEWLKNWERQHDAVNIREFQLEHDSIWRLLTRPWSYDLDSSMDRGSLTGHISDFPGEPGVWLGKDVWEHTISFMIDERRFLLLLVTLPLVYGGIHLATWDFHFASKTEHLLWKIACFDIMGTIPFGVLCFLGFRRLFSLSNDRYFNDVLLNDRYSNDEGLDKLYQPLLWAFYSPLATLYALARLYIVVESFISLRHVPIGSYAAVPWVQDIPHV